MTYRVRLSEEALVAARACRGGVDLLASLGAAIDVEITPLHELLLAARYPDVAAWLRARRLLRRPSLAGLALDGWAMPGAWLPRADLSGCSLRGADLSRADLRRADLSRADLSGCLLHGAQLAGAVVVGALRPDGWGAWRERDGVLE